MKKNFNLSLEKEQTEKFQAYLNKFGLTFSGFIGNVIEDSLHHADFISVVMDEEKTTYRGAKKLLSQEFEIGVFQ